MFPEFKSDNFAVKKFLNGWWVGNIVTAQTGYAFTPVLTNKRSNSGTFGGSQGDRPNLGTDTLTTTLSGRSYTFIPFDPETVVTGDPNQWFNPLMFRLGPAGFLGNASRNMLRGPGLATWNVSFNKDTSLGFLGENGRLQFRAEIFNILNHANFGIPNGTVFTGTVTDGAGATEAPAGSTNAIPLGTAGQIRETATTSRQIQLALKLIF